MIVKSRCGLNCGECDFRAPHHCGGCIETMGHPFHGECPVAACCQQKGHTHCGECGAIPCAQLYDYSYLDLEHGDKPPGARVAVCRGWAAQQAGKAWDNVLLTSTGFEDMQGRQRPHVVRRFLEMFGKPANQARVLFIPAAVLSDEAKRMADWCYDELIRIGIQPSHITTERLERAMPEAEAMAHDAVYVTGGDTAHLLARLRETGMDEIIKKMVYSGKTYVGVSAGSIIATPNIGDPGDPKTAGLCLIHAYLSVHCPQRAAVQEGQALPRLSLTDECALAVRYDGYEWV